MNENIRALLKDKKRIVIKIGSSSLQHPETGDLDYVRMEVLIRELCDLKNQGKDVVLVSSGAIAAGRKAVHIKDINKEHGENHIAVKQACAAVGQARLMMSYEKLFSEYNHTPLPLHTPSCRALQFSSFPHRLPLGTDVPQRGVTQKEVFPALVPAGLQLVTGR